MSYIIPFSQLNKTNIPTAGGKGANLGEMIVGGFPVPAGFVLTTAAYDAFVQAHGLQQQIVDWTNSAAADDPQLGTATAEKIQRLFLNADLPETIVDELLAAWHDLGELYVAVRSSATAEDLPTASFAGQQETFLNVQDEAALLEAVKKCWASLWTARAMAYRLHQDIDPASVSLAVVVQKLVDADSSGILFTANPTSGERDQILINAAWGLGEAIVGGLVTPDSVVVDQGNWQIVSRETATKTVMTVRTESGTQEQAVPQAQQNQAVLDDATAVELARIGAQIEAHYEMPMDVEWAIADGEIAILQARPITSLPPEPLKNVTWEPPTPDTIWMRRQIVEHMPDPLSPLFEELYLKKGMEQSIDQLMRAMGEIGGVQIDLKEMMPHGFADAINGYAYTTGSFKMSGENLKTILRIYARIFRFFNATAFDWHGVVLPGYQALIDQWQSIDLAETPDAELLRGIGEMAAADSSYWFGSSLNLGLSRMMDPLFDKLLKSPLIRHALPQPKLGSSAFLRGFDSKALDAQADMERIADAVRGSASLRELVLNTGASQLPAALAAHPDGQPVLDGIDHYLDEYGHQIYNLDFVDPTQNEEPLPLLLSLKALVKDAPAEAVRVRQAKMARERDALVAQTRQALNPLSRRLFEWMWKWTKHYAPYREHVMFYMGAAWPAVRKLAHELGQRLAAAGAIAAPDDLYYLESSEIAAAIEARASGQSVPQFAGLAQERRALRAARKRLAPLPKVPERSSLKFGPIDLSLFDPTPSGVVNQGSILNGYAVGTGRVSAPASVIRSSADFNEMQPGSILVCTTTTPAWTPLFSQAVGLVTDVGGALAHGSIVAREYGIPAVMGTGVATERIQSGMMLAVDGDAGTVTLLDEVAGEVADQVAGGRSLPRDARTDLSSTSSAVRKWALLVLAVGIAVGSVVKLMAWRKKRRPRKGKDAGGPSSHV